MFETFEEFVGWLLTPVGLGIAATAIVGLLKKIDGPAGSWWKKAGDWIRDHALPVSVAVCAAIGTIAYVVELLRLAQYAERVWPLVVLVWLASQGMYNLQKAASRALLRRER